MASTMKSKATARRADRAPFLLAGAVVLLAASGLFLYHLWTRVETLSARFENAEQRELELEAVTDQTSRAAAEAQQDSSAANLEAAEAVELSQQATRSRSEAEREREAARRQAERAEQERAEAEQAAASSREAYQRIRDARSSELDRMQEALAKIVETERTPIGMVMRLSEESLQFDFDEAAIRPEDKELLSRIAGVLLSSHGYQLYIYGHTDDQGPERYNQQLSLRRAEAVRDYFARAGIQKEIMKTKGFGESSPRVRGRSEKARQQNRRVEIGLVDTVIDYEGVNVYGDRAAVEP